MMDDDELLWFVTEFRKGILGESQSDLMCLAICGPLSAILWTRGVETKLVENELDELDCNHFWLELPDWRIIDPTADQFNEATGETLPPVYIGPPTKIHANPKEINYGF